MAVEYRACPTPAYASALEEGDGVPHGGLSGVVREAVHRVLSHQHPVVALVPEYHGEAKPSDASAGDDTDDRDADRISFSLLSHFALPPSSVVFPGSFNPVHEGHVKLAKAAMEEVPQLRNVVWFEMSLTNADKPSLSVEEVTRRVRGFAEAFAGELAALVDFQWGLLLSNAPLFRQKVDILQPLLVPASGSGGGGGGGDPSDDFLDVVIGTDTLVRLVDPKYYQGSADCMVQALEATAARFVVGGRVIQPVASASSSFVSGHDAVAGLPEGLRSRFVLLPEDTFRVDLSSTEIRRKLQAAEPSAGEDGAAR